MSWEEEEVVVLVLVVRATSWDHTLQEGQEVKMEQQDPGGVSSATLCWTRSSTATS